MPALDSSLLGWGLFFCGNTDLYDMFGLHIKFA